ncbi:outer membrane beta-barrel protein [Tenacibaculum sp. UWU-22]|uniref:outer membrane beta-barrel protein n=1 Tax=Tenacibaculum sp. UWU-22 TaxID=3234187 RepID=UPI0034DAE60D
MIKKLLLTSVLLFTNFIFSQSYPFKITGKIISDSEKQPIESATIHIERVKDSSVVSYTISNEKGNFSLEGKSFFKDLKLFVSFVGMADYSKPITLGEKSVFNLNEIHLKENNVLNEVVIKSRAPITIKKDTLEFNVKSFKTKKEASVEDLLKKLPGVEVDKDGNITINGKPVNKVLVNGKPFFGDDPTITTKNLPKEIIEKIQVTDTKTKSEAFTGEKGDVNNKTINLTIKKENNKGWFGRVSAGVGTDKHYEGATMINRFDNDQRITVLASANNINSPGFSFGEIEKMFGGSRGVSFNSSDQGIVKSKTAGVTYADKYGKGFDVNGNYFFSGSNTTNASKSNREYNLPNKKYFTTSTSKSDSNNDNNQINADFDIEIDSTLLINVRPSFTFNKRERVNDNNQESFNENKELTNSYNSSSRTKSEANNFRNRLYITKKLNSKGAFIKASITNQFNTSNADGFNKSTIEIFGDNPSEEIRDQKSFTDNNSTNFYTRIMYRYPLISGKMFLDTKYSYNSQKQKNKKNTYDFNKTTQQYDGFNTDLSSDFTYNNINKIPSLELSYRTKKTRIGLESALINRTLENNDKLRPESSLKKEYNNLGLDADFRYQFDSKASVYFDYSLDNSVPSINQLQPFTDVTNPSNIKTGNPDLKPTQQHHLYANFNKYNWQAGSGFWFYISSSLYNNQIVSKTTIGDDLVRKNTYENIDGGYSYRGGGGYGKKVKLDSIANITFRLGARANTNKDFNILNDVKEGTKTTSLSPDIGITFDWNNLAFLETRYRVSFSKTKYDVNANQNKDFTRHSLSIRTRTTFPKKLEWRNDIQYTFNPNIIGFNKSSWFWNASFTYSLFKDRGIVSLKAYDLLNQNTNAQRRATSTYIEDSESTVLQQYFMLGFSWKFNTLGEKGEIRKHRFHF